MRFLKHNFVFIFLAISSVAMGVVALTTALQLREFKDITPQTKALTPTCKFVFTIADSAPRETGGKIAQNITPLPNPTVITVTLKPTISLIPTTTPKIGSLVTTITPTPSQTLKPTPTTALLAKGTTISPTKTVISPTKVPVPTAVKVSSPTATLATPQLPVSGILLPTLGIILFGFFFLTVGFFGKIKAK